MDRAPQKNFFKNVPEVRFWHQGYQMKALLKVDEEYQISDLRSKDLKSSLNSKNFRWITCSWHKRRILQCTNLKCCIKGKEPFKTPFQVLFFDFKDILKHYKFMNYWLENSFFDVSNRLELDLFRLSRSSGFLEFWLNFINKW